MAEVQQAGPLIGQNFTDATWRAILGGEPAIVGDTNGSAYNLTLPPASDSVELGSTSIQSTAVVGGFAHIVPAGTTQSLVIPPSTDASVGRTDLISVRLDPTTYTAAPGPVRLYRIPGTEGSAAAPSYDDGPPGVEDMPLYAITRKLGEALTQADVTDLRVRTGPHLLTEPGVTPFPSLPLGSTATRDGIDWSRELDSGGSPVWVERHRPVERLLGLDATQEAADNWQRQTGCEMVRDGEWRSVNLVARRSGSTVSSTSNGNFNTGDLRVMRLHSTDRPVRDTPVSAILRTATGGNTYGAGAYIDSAGWLVIVSTNPNLSFGPSGPLDTVRVQTAYYRAS